MHPNGQDTHTDRTNRTNLHTDIHTHRQDRHTTNRPMHPHTCTRTVHPHTYIPILNLTLLITHVVNKLLTHQKTTCSSVRIPMVSLTITKVPELEDARHPKAKTYGTSPPPFQTNQILLAISLQSFSFSSQHTTEQQTLPLR